MHVFRIHIRPKGGTTNMQKTFAYCLENNLLGVGWKVDALKCTKNWDEYFQLASPIHSNLQVCEYIKKWVTSGDLVWTRDHKGDYYLAKVISGWEYWTSTETEKFDIDIGNIFRCKFQKVEIDSVPGTIVACFRASRTIQEIADQKAIEYSKYLWNELSKDGSYPIQSDDFKDIFMMLDDEETEDIVFLYLQSKGWYVLPNSRKGDTMSFEYLAVDPKTGEKALTQVKSGESKIKIDNYLHYKEKIFLFQSNQPYDVGCPSSNVVCITREEMLQFMESALFWLPDWFKKKWSIVKR